MTLSRVSFVDVIAAAEIERAREREREREHAPKEDSPPALLGFIRVYVRRLETKHTLRRAVLTKTK